MYNKFVALVGVYEGCNYFNLKVKNKSNQDYSLNWNNSYFLYNKQTNRAFYFAGINYSEANNNKPNNIILSQSKISKEIYPAYLL